MTPVEEEDYSFGTPYLLEVFPNPFSQGLTIDLTVETAEMTTLRVIDQMGQEVANLVDREWKTPGTYRWVLDETLFEGNIFFLEHITRQTVNRVLIVRESGS